ncbi:MAG: tetratricopeptide repeat protein [bacterium]
MYKKFAFTIFLVFAVLSLVYALKSDRDVTTSSNLAYDYYQEGTRLSEQLYTRDACEQYERAVAEDSTFAMALARLSGCYADLGFKEKSEAAWEAAYAHKAEVSERERLLLDMWAAEKDRDTATVRKGALEYVDKYPQYRDGYLMLGSLEMMSTNFEAAIEHFTDALAADPEYANGHNMLGYLNYYLGRYDEALRHLTDYSRLAPNEANPHDSRGEILHAMGRYDEAIEEFRAAFNINPEFAYAVEHMGQSYLALGRSAKVEYCFSTLIDRAESLERRHYFALQYGEALLNELRYDSARAVFNDVLSEDTENVAALIDLGYSYYLQRNKDQAFASFDRFAAVQAAKQAEKPELKDDAGIKRTEKYIAALRADLDGDLPKSAELLGEVVDDVGIPTTKIRIRYYYANVLFRDGEIDRAKSELQKNLTINPNHVRTLLLLADIYEQEEDHQSALSYRQRAAEIWKDADSDFLPAQQLREKIARTLAMVAE